MRRAVMCCTSRCSAGRGGDLGADVDPDGERDNPDDSNCRRQHPFRGQHQGDGNPRRPLSWADDHCHEQSSNGWTKIEFAGSTAHVLPCKYLTKGSKLPSPKKLGFGTVKITTTALNLRSGPGLSHKVIKVLKGRHQSHYDRQDRTGVGRSWSTASPPAGPACIIWPARQPDARRSSVSGVPATADLDIRMTSGADARTVAEVKKGTALSVTGAIQNGRAQIIYKDAIRWVTARYLANVKSNLPSSGLLPKITGTRLRHRDTEHPPVLHRQIPADHRGTSRNRSHHRRRQERPDSDHLRQGRPLGDREVPFEVAHDRHLRAGGRSREVSSRMRSRSIEPLARSTADQDLLHRAGRRVHRPLHLVGHLTS